jgi:methionyl-tRNA formyltransferase
MGTAGFACPSLETLARSAVVAVAGVVTQPDRPGGRGLRLQPSPVKTVAQRLGLKVLQPARLRQPESLQLLAEVHPELIVVAAYGQILPRTVLDLPRLGCLNVHGSLLPRHRGAAPVQWALLSGDRETGVTLMKMDEGLDTGPVLAQEATAITADDDAATLHDRLADLGARLLLEKLPGYADGSIGPCPQPTAGVTYARKLTREDGCLDWRQTARVLWNRVRALRPWPGASTHRSDPHGATQLKIWRVEWVEGAPGAPGEVLQADRAGILVACGEDALRVLELQREGGKRLGAAPFLAGQPVRPGERWG